MLRSSKKSVAVTYRPLLLAALTAVLLMAVSVTARAGKPQVDPSPFAGHYMLGTECRITISDSGQIKDSRSFYSGSIDNDGFMTLTSPSISFSVGRGGNVKPIKSTEIGYASLDEFGDLHAVLVDEYDRIRYNYWPLCD